jgi:hypothetical protein
VVLLVTALVVAALGVVFLLLRWDDANKVAAVASALGAVAAIGVAIWAALPARPRVSVQVTRTGDARAVGTGRANTGVTGRVGEGEVSAADTGDADASSGGDANTGVRLD